MLLLLLLLLLLLSHINIAPNFRFKKHKYVSEVLSHALEFIKMSFRRAQF
jgi:hypothetical protein